MQDLVLTCKVTYLFQEAPRGESHESKSRLTDYTPTNENKAVGDSPDEFADLEEGVDEISQIPL